MPYFNDFTTQQQAALDQIEKWFDANETQVFRLFGYAGTGKTTLARTAAQVVGGKVLFGAYTGKAAYVLRSKGCADASTIHGLIYMPKERARYELERLVEELRNELDPGLRKLIQVEIDRLERELRQPDFILRDTSPLDEVDMLIVDEVSMVGERMARDLLSFDCRLLVLGDPAQLPPVEGAGYFVNADPDVLLTEIHRSALDSPVTRIATAVRRSAVGDPTMGIDWHSDGDSGSVQVLEAEAMVEFDQVIVGRNATRWRLTHALRHIRGLVGPMPVAGDRIMFLANNPSLDVFNGQQATVIDAQPHPRRDGVLLLDVIDDDNQHARTVPVWGSGFLDPDGQEEARGNGRGDVAAATFGWVVTTHKAQGSQWGSVLVVDESAVFGNGKYREVAATRGHDAARVASHEARRRWLYTAVTRAAQRIVVVDRIAA